MNSTLELKPEQLRRKSDPSLFSFQSTAELPALERVLGQERAVHSIDFGVDMPSRGYNIYAMGPPGSGRTTAVRQFLDRRAGQRAAPWAWCYVYDFDDPRRPKAIDLPPGRAAKLRAQMDDLLEQLQREIPRAFEGQPYEERRRELVLEMQKRQQELYETLERYLNERGFALIRSQSGLGIAPMLNGEVLSAEDYKKLDQETKKRFEDFQPELQEQFDKTMRQARDLDREGKKSIEEISHELAGFVVTGLVADIKEGFQDCPKVLVYLDRATQDIVQNVRHFLPTPEGESLPFPLAGASGDRWFARYRVNVLAEAEDHGRAPVVIEDNPTYHNLIGRIEHRAEFGTMVTDFTQIRVGALHRANGGYLVVEAKSLLTNALAWDALKRSLRNQEIKIEEMAQFYGLVATSTLEPEPIPLDVKVVIIGDQRLYQLLYAFDEDFGELFKVKAEFASTMGRDEEVGRDYALFVGDLCQREGLRHFDPGAVARLLEEASRLAEDKGRVTARFASVADLVREASFWAGRAGRDLVTAPDVRTVVDERTYRLNHAVERYIDRVQDGVILIDTEGSAVGQVNGLSVVQAADFMFGLPSRITAKTFMGKAQVVSIEREVKMSGPIHDKGQLILSSYLASRFAQKQTLSMAASLTFEQLYSGVEGDSASSTELYALLSSLGDTPISQGLAVTGSVNQSGHVQAIGGVNAKIEGFYDVCVRHGLTGQQGVMIPASNVQHLMLRDDVVGAVADGGFHIYAVSTIEEGIELLTGTAAGTPDEEGEYPEDTVYGRVQAKLDLYAQNMKKEQEKEPGNGSRDDGDEGPDDTDAPPVDAAA